MKITLFVTFAFVAISWQSVLAEDRVLLKPVEPIPFIEPVTVPFIPLRPQKKVASATTKTFIVAAERADCQGFIRMRCLQVKENPTDRWSFFYGGIGGFEHEPGYEYVLKVKAEELENPPADGSSVEYTLLEQVSKTKM